MTCTKSLVLVLCAAAAVHGSNPTVKVEDGVLQGAWRKTDLGRTYASFQGVPYARPPVGNLRFQSPEKVISWPGVWYATKQPPACLQYEPFYKNITGSEDCLYLNIYTAKPSRGAKLPVLIFIHGGAFMYGSEDMAGPRHLLDRDLILVTLNYRLGPLGFLSTGDEAAPGNLGLKDQSFALHWIKNNIEMFGGDPESITLTGCSAGGASVHFHYLSPLSKDTFTRGIAFSGAAFAPWTIATKPLEHAKELAALVGCPNTSSKKIIQCLRNRPAVALLDAQIQMMRWKVHLFTPFTPTVESPAVSKPFLTEYPYHAAVAGRMQNLPLMVTIDSEEGLYPAAVYQSSPELLPELESGWETLASHIFEYSDTLPAEQRPSVAAKIKEHYLKGKRVDQDSFHDLVEAMGDRLFNVDSGRLAQIHATKTKQPVYIYRYSYRGEESLSDLMAENTENYGVSHADDVRLISSLQLRTPDDQQMKEAMIDMIYSYMTTGVPIFKNSPKWDPVKPGSEELTYMEILSATDYKVKSTADFGQRSFWDNLGFKENANRNTIRDEL